MKRKQPAWVLYFLLLTLFAAAQFQPSCQAAVSDANSVQISDSIEPLRETVAALRQQRQDFQKAQQANQLKIEQAKETLGHLEVRHAGLTERQAELDRQLETLRKEVHALESKNAETSQALVRANAVLGPFTAVVEPLIQKGLPCEKEQRLSDLSKAGQLSAADMLAAIWNFVQRELRTARSAEAFSRPITLEDGRILHARLLQIGHHFLAFVSEDSQLAGQWNGTGWETTTDPARIRDLIQALDILDQQAQPALLPLPFELSVETLSTHPQETQP